MSDQTFHTKDVEVDYEQWSGKATIEWTYETDMREWGVKDFVVCVPDQDIVVDWKHLDEDDETQPPETLSLKNVTVTINATFRDSLCPTGVSVYKEEWEVTF